MNTPALEAYNYAEFDLDKELKPFLDFRSHEPHAGELAPDFPLENLETGETVQLKNLWAKNFLIVEFGAFT